MAMMAKIDKILIREVLKKDYEELQSTRKIAEKYNISHETVRNYIHKYELDYNKLKLYDVDHNFFQKENEAVFYVAGFIAADGCVKIRKNTYELGIGLSKKDKEFLENIRFILKAETPVRDFLIKNSKRNPDWNDTWKSELTITSKQIFDDLVKFNIVPRKSLTYTFPEWLIEHPLVHHFMRGYNDGDGSFYVPRLAEGKITKQVYLSIRGTSKFLEVYRSILEQKCDLKERTKDIRINTGIGVLEYGGNSIVEKIANFLYQDATIFLPRKHTIISHLLNNA